jgi:enoyl-CoA hydratase/carnithine racemase
MNSGNTVDGGGSLPAAVKNRILAGSAKNFVAGFDVKADMSDFDMWYSKDNQQLRFSCRFNIGVVNHFVDQIVQYTNA